MDDERLGKLRAGSRSISRNSRSSESRYNDQPFYLEWCVVLSNSFGCAEARRPDVSRTSSERRVQCRGSLLEFGARGDLRSMRLEGQLRFAAKCVVIAAKKTAREGWFPSLNLVPSSEAYEFSRFALTVTDM
jgi:hypothetical protein